MISKYNESRREKRILMDGYDIPMTEELERHTRPAMKRKKLKKIS